MLGSTDVANRRVEVKEVGTGHSLAQVHDTKTLQPGSSILDLGYSAVAAGVPRGALAAPHNFLELKF